MKDLRKAAEMALEALEWINRVNAMDYEYQRKAQEPIQALRQALAQPEQGNSNSNYPNTKANTSLKHEPWCDSVTKLLLSFPPQIPPCNCKPKREWVGLTDQERQEIVRQEVHWSGICRVIEAKLKEKNGG